MQESSASTQGPEKDASQWRLFLQRADRINRLSGGAHKDDADDEWLMWWRGAIIKPPPPKAPQRVRLVVGFARTQQQHHVSSLTLLRKSSQFGMAAQDTPGRNRQKAPASGDDFFTRVALTCPIRYKHTRHQ